MPILQRNHVLPGPLELSTNAARASQLFATGKVLEERVPHGLEALADVLLDFSVCEGQRSDPSALIGMVKREADTRRAHSCTRDVRTSLVSLWSATTLCSMRS